mgnify:CR=1 FL=1
MEFIAWHSRKPAVHLSWPKWGVWAAYYLGVWTCETELVRLYFLSIPAWIHVLNTALTLPTKTSGHSSCGTADTRHVNTWNYELFSILCISLGLMAVIYLTLA